MLLPEYMQQRASLKLLLPREGNAVIYRKCKCGRVYVKPMGCDGVTTCGARVSLASDILTERYHYSGTKLSFLQSTSSYLKPINQVRALWRQAVDRIFETRLWNLAASATGSVWGKSFVPFSSSSNQVDQHTNVSKIPEYGCGKTIVWRLMEPVDLASSNEGEILDMQCIYQLANTTQSVNHKL